MHSIPDTFYSTFLIQIFQMEKHTPIQLLSLNARKYHAHKVDYKKDIRELRFVIKNKNSIEYPHRWSLELFGPWSENEKTEPIHRYSLSKNSIQPSLCPQSQFRFVTRKIIDAKFLCIHFWWMQISAAQTRQRHSLSHISAFNT